ncbi:MAG: hypothetical protein ABEH80_01820 [Halobaculum sp.]
MSSDNETTRTTDSPAEVVGRPAAFQRRVRRLLGDARWATRATLGDRGGITTVAAGTVVYTLIYLVAVGDLGLRASGRRAGGNLGSGVTLDTVSAPVARALGGEAVALLGLGPVELLVTPVSLGLGVGLGVLVGLNLGVSTLAYRQPAACDVSPTTGLAASLPALLSGTACCGPLVLIVIGVQASSALVSVFAWLRPAAVLLLAASLLWASDRLARGRQTTA